MSKKKKEIKNELDELRNKARRVEYLAARKFKGEPVVFTLSLLTTASDEELKDLLEIRLLQEYVLGDEGLEDYLEKEWVGKDLSDAHNVLIYTRNETDDNLDVELAIIKDKAYVRDYKIRHGLIRNN